MFSESPPIPQSSDMISLKKLLGWLSIPLCKTLILCLFLRCTIPSELCGNFTSGISEQH